MKKQFTILSILLFSFGLFFAQFFNASAAVTVSDISEIPKITSISPANVRIGETIEVIGENFNFINQAEGGAAGKTIGIALTPTINTTPICSGVITNFSNTNLTIQIGPCNSPGQAAISLDYSANIEGHSEYHGSISDSYGPRFTIIEACEWECSNWNNEGCPKSGVMTETRICVKPEGCESLTTPMPATSKTTYCVPSNPVCTLDDYNCTEWSVCEYKLTSKGFETIQTRSCPTRIACDSEASTRPVVQRSCTIIPQCTYYSWSCSSWSTCSPSGAQTRTCNKNSNCEGGTSSPATTQSCTYTPTCSADTWQCGNWGTCSPQGIQTRSCTRTFDCSSVETASPATSQYCESSYQQNYQSPSANSDIVTNQDAIIKATVKLICPISSTLASQGSGTVINSTGLILTNKHVIDGTAGCWVGFIDDYDDEPYFADRQIADIYKVSSDADIAVLKLRNPNSKSLTAISISQSNSSNIELGEILTTYGYPAKFGTNITYTSGDFSGIDGYYLKTTAVIEHGNSGGGAYLKNGSFIGIPTAVVKGSLNSMGYLLSVNKINSWLNNSVAYNYNTNNNNYSRVSALLEDMDLNGLGSLGLYVTGDDSGNSEQSTVNIDTKLSNRLKGKLLLQVEEKGRIWYVNPGDVKRYEVTFANALPLFQKFALGITNANLDKIPLNTETRTTTLGNQQKGKLLLQVEDRGRIWYVDFNGRRWEVTWANLMDLFESLSLGITNADLSKIAQGSL
ncbi:trypsin-like peptidase domain-containing protein [Candidatus Kuenenbacteria bacterium]|nr:trypsin-like peptidase domain-containing protein [Candidatus Kuenenbacteria bacterium]